MYHFGQMTVGLMLSVWLAAPHSWAADRLETLSSRLANHQDFRVRTQAALALGTSRNKAAVAPLCEALADSSTTVRAASAAALGRLQRGGKECLKQRLATEVSASVREVLQRSLELLGGATDHKQLTSTSRYYVAIGDIRNTTGRGGGEVQRMARAAMADAISALRGYVVAPEGETPKQAKTRLAKHKSVVGFFLIPTVGAPVYSGGSLSVRVEIAIFTYPGKAMKGVIPVKLTQPGVSGTSRAIENDLIRAASERAIAKLSENVRRLD
jgi:hypothetical protein